MEKPMGMDGKTSSIVAQIEEMASRDKLAAMLLEATRNQYRDVKDALPPEKQLVLDNLIQRAAGIMSAVEKFGGDTPDLLACIKKSQESSLGPR